MSDKIADPRETQTAPSGKPQWRKRLGKWVGKVRGSKRRRLLGESKRALLLEVEEGGETDSVRPNWIGETIRLERRHDGAADDAPAKVVSEKGGFAMGIPVLEIWEQLGDGSIYGQVFGSDIMKDGVWITTSPVITGCVKSWVLVRAASGERYFLGRARDDADGSKGRETGESWFAFADEPQSLLCTKGTHGMDVLTDTASATDISWHPEHSEYTGDSQYTFSEYTGDSQYTSQEPYSEYTKDSKCTTYSEYTEATKSTAYTYEESPDGQSASTTSSSSSDDARHSASNSPRESLERERELHSNKSSAKARSEESSEENSSLWNFGWCS